MGKGVVVVKVSHTQGQSDRGGSRVEKGSDLLMNVWR